MLHTTFRYALVILILTTCFCLATPSPSRAGLWDLWNPGPSFVERHEDRGFLAILWQFLGHLWASDGQCQQYDSEGRCIADPNGNP